MANSGVEDMRQETGIVWHWLRINVPTLLAIGGLIWYTAANNAEQRARIEGIEKSREERSSVSDKRFADIHSAIAAVSHKIDPLPNVVYRVGVMESRIDETNKRLDRLQETIINSLDLIRKDVGAVSTKVEVLTQKVDSMIAAPAARRAGDFIGQPLALHSDASNGGEECMPFSYVFSCGTSQVR